MTVQMMETAKVTEYWRVTTEGKLVVGLPDSLKYDGWFIYAAPSHWLLGTDAEGRGLELYWVNHVTEECCPYCLTCSVIDPTTYPHDMKG